MPLGPNNVNMVRQIRQLAKRDSDSVMGREMIFEQSQRNGSFCEIFRVCDLHHTAKPVVEAVQSVSEIGATRANRGTQADWLHVCQKHKSGQMREPAVRSRASNVPKLAARLNTNTPKPAKNR